MCVGLRDRFLRFVPYGSHLGQFFVKENNGVGCI